MILVHDSVDLLVPVFGSRFDECQQVGVELVLAGAAEAVRAAGIGIDFQDGMVAIVETPSLDDECYGRVNGSKAAIGELFAKDGEGNDGPEGKSWAQPNP